MLELHGDNFTRVIPTDPWTCHPASRTQNAVFNRVESLQAHKAFP
jgi:hypothetical protein